MSNYTPTEPNDRYPLRVRFRKEGLLRWISHHDLMRTFERLARRAQLPLSMSKGFHPKPRIRFPSALALGIEGLDEVVELDVTQPLAAELAHQRLAAVAPNGLAIQRVEQFGPGAAKARIRTTVYRFDVPPERSVAVARAIEKLEKQEMLVVQRPDRPAPVEVPLNLEYVMLDDHEVRFCLRETHHASARPRDVLRMLGLDDLEQQGRYLQRTKVELVS